LPLLAERQTGLGSAIGEQPLSRTEDDRKDHQAQLVNQAIGEETSHEAAAAADQDVA